VESGDLFEGEIEPGVVGQGVGAEGFDPAFLAVEEEGAVEAEPVGLGRVNEAGGVVGAHLEEDAEFEFSDGLAAELAEEIGVGVAGEDDVAAEVGALGDDAVEDEPGVLEGGVGVEGEGGVLVVAEFFVVLDAVDEEEEFGVVG